VVNLPAVAVVPYNQDRYLLVRWEGDTWVNVESGLEYGPDLPAGSEYLTRAVDNPDGELCSQIALAHAALRDALTATAGAWRGLARTFRARPTLGNTAAGVAYDVAAGDVEDALVADATSVLGSVMAANERARTTTTAEIDGG
jgi:hypothetical protein